MSVLLDRKDVLPFAAECGGALKIEKSFALTVKSESVRACMRACTLAKYCGEAPHIAFRLSIPNFEKPLYLSHSYRLGGAERFERQSFRIPPMLDPSITLSLEVELPAGTVLYLKELEVCYQAPPRDLAAGLRFNAHLGLIGMAPDNTMPAFELAALCGFHTCIAVPKLTKDGKLVCIHDDTVNRTARLPDGSRLPDTPLQVSDLTYAELLQYDFGVQKRPIYKGTKIPLLEDFFRLCAETGMHPMFSTHPALPHGAWLEVKEMLKRYEILPHFHVKSFSPDILKAAHDVFGDEIDGYTHDVHRMEPDTVERLLATGVNVNACRVGVEIRSENLKKEDIPPILAAGMFASAWNLPRADFDTLYGRLISFGVTEFTEDYHISF